MYPTRCRIAPRVANSSSEGSAHRIQAMSCTASASCTAQWEKCKGDISWFPLQPQAEVQAKAQGGLVMHTGEELSAIVCAAKFMVRRGLSHCDMISRPQHRPASARPAAGLSVKGSTGTGTGTVYSTRVPGTKRPWVRRSTDTFTVILSSFFFFCHFS